jgi:hypothetical protein
LLVPAELPDKSSQEQFPYRQWDRACWEFAASSRGSYRARHPAIQNIQDIFHQKADRLYHWADDREIPADNNLAERELRPLVIARKISFGSQSEKGARTREILMTVLHTLKKRTPDAMAAFKSALDKLAEQSDTNPAKLLFALDSS